jgi:two-component sensor histidine kinase
MISWAVLKNGAEPALKIVWHETVPGEKPSPSNKPGFGSTVLMRVVPGLVSGQCSYEINASSVIWELESPASAIAEIAIGNSVAEGPAVVA